MIKFCYFSLFILLWTIDLNAAGLEQHGFPRIMGMNIARPAFYDTADYQKSLSKPDIVILGFWEGWGKSKKKISEQDVVRRLKEMNPVLVVGQYTLLNEWKDETDTYNARPALSRKLDEENWWLRDEKGNRVRWTEKYRAWDINITNWVNPDDNGNRYPEWLAAKDYETFFQPVSEFDIWYIDNFLSRPSAKSADWDRDGKKNKNNEPKISAAYRRGNIDYLEIAKKLSPQALIIVNSDDISSKEYSMQCHGVFMEALIGKTWSTELLKGWAGMMARYREAMKHTAPPHIVGFNVHGKKDDYQRMRYGLTSCLLDDGYFSYTDQDTGYGSVPWFDEFNINLGKPIDPPPCKPWKEGVYKRRFEYGMVIVNPSLFKKTISLGVGWRRFSGHQAPEINNGEDVSKLTLQGKDGLILLKTKPRLVL